MFSVIAGNFPLHSSILTVGLLQVHAYTKGVPRVLVSTQNPIANPRVPHSAPYKSRLIMPMRTLANFLIWSKAFQLPPTIGIPMVQTTTNDVLHRAIYCPPFVTARSGTS